MKLISNQHALSRAMEVGNALRASRDTAAIAAANERMKPATDAEIMVRAAAKQQGIETRKLCPNCITRECFANWCYGQGCECDCDEAVMFRGQGADAVHAQRRANWQALVAVRRDKGE